MSISRNQSPNCITSGLLKGKGVNRRIIKAGEKAALLDNALQDRRVRIIDAIEAGLDHDIAVIETVLTLALVPDIAVIETVLTLALVPGIIIIGIRVDIGQGHDPLA